VECCWDKEIVAMGDCPNITEGDEDLLTSRSRRFLEKCCECERFYKDLDRFNASGHPLAPIFTVLHNDYRHQKIQIQSLVSFLDSKTLETRFLHELGTALQNSVDLDEVLSVALTAITAGKGFGMNRVFLLLADRERRLLYGHLAIGPRSPEEASQIWQEIASTDMDLRSMAHVFQQQKLHSERDKFQHILDKLQISFDDQEHIIVKAFENPHPVLVQDAFNNPRVTPEFARLLGVNSFMILPLVSRHRRIGAMIADNFITNNPITTDDLLSIETFSRAVAFAIERASLYEKLQEQVDELQTANHKLKEQQELLVRMEKMALVGRITSSVAHSIRNPLTVIGGFARNILKATSPDDSRHSFITSIVNETKQLESVLDEVLTYSDSIYPARDFWDPNQIIEAAANECQDRILLQDYSLKLHTNAELPQVWVDFRQVVYCIKTIILVNLDGLTRGTISISAAVVDNYVEIKIKDAGRNLSEDELEAMLTPFAETCQMGSGLSLALCRNMLDKQKIPFLVIAPPHGGVTYSLKLPTIKEKNHEQIIDS